MNHATQGVPRGGGTDLSNRGATLEKLRKERERREKQQDKAARRQQRRTARENGEEPSETPGVTEGAEPMSVADASPDKASLA